ncbi:MAG: aminotransferase class IV [Albidovulum sp.]|nr:aminotransferase class IV [Albidovulum sp.]
MRKEKIMKYCEEILGVCEVMANDPRHRRGVHDDAFTDGSAFIIDRFYPLSEAAVPVTDLGFLRADAAYDVVTVSRGKFFRLDDHQDRFAKSCERVRLTNPFSRREEADLLSKLVALTGLKDAYVWWCVTRGTFPEKPSDRLIADKFENRFYAFAVPYIFVKDDAERTRGIDLCVSKSRIRIPPRAVDPRAKNFCSLDLAMSLFEAGDRGSDWSILAGNGGFLTEAPSCNIFLVRDGVARTPETGVLEGITRATALELCAELGLEARTASLKTEDLTRADEAFLTSSAGGIIPVVSVDGIPLRGCDGPGPVSRKLHNLYWRKRWSGWRGKQVRYA